MIHLGVALSSLLLIVEAAVVAWRKCNKPSELSERLVEAIALFVIACSLGTAGLVELASELAGAPPSLFSRCLTKRIGRELVLEAERHLNSALELATFCSAANSILISALLVASLFTGGVAILILSLSLAGLGFALALLSSSVLVAHLLRFVGQLYTALAVVGDIAYALAPLAFSLLVPRATRRLGAALMTICVGFSLVLPAALNSTAVELGGPLEATVPQRELGLLRFRVTLTVPVANLNERDANYTVAKLNLNAPPGVVVVYEDWGRRAARLAGTWYVEFASEYRVSKLIYAGYYLPVAPMTFTVKPGVRAEVVCRSPGVCALKVNDSGAADVEVLIGSAYDVPLVLFDDALGVKYPPRRWGFWTGRGFYVLRRSLRLGSPTWWYNSSYFLGSHEVVGILDPQLCEAHTGESVIPVCINGSCANVTVRRVDVVAWVQGSVDAYELCKGGRPKVLDPGESLIEVNGTLLRLAPELSCEVKFVEPPLADARREVEEQFSHFVRVLNASLPPTLAGSSPSISISSSISIERCIYSKDVNVINAVMWNGTVLYSQSLWPRREVPLVVVRARYYGKLKRPAVIGPARAHSEAVPFSHSLTLAWGGETCPPLLKVSGYDVMNENVVAGLVYDSLAEEMLSGELAERVARISREILKCMESIALILTSLAAATIGVGLLSGLLGSSPLLLPLPHLYRAAIRAVEQVGEGVKAIVRAALSLLSKGKGSQLRGSHYDEMMKMLANPQRVRERLEGSEKLARTLRWAIPRRALSIGLSSNYPFPLALRVASEVFRQAALRTVHLDLPYHLRVREALMRAGSGRLLLISDVLYAAAWILDSKPLSAPLAARLVRGVWREYRFLHPPLLTRRRAAKLPEVKRYLTAEKALVKICKHLARGEEPSAKLISRAVAALEWVHLPPYARALAKIQGVAGDELGWRVLALAQSIHSHRLEYEALLLSRPRVALVLADLAALRKLPMDKWWERAVFCALSRLEGEVPGINLASIWLSSRERGEPWRYLAVRFAAESTKGREPWFSPSLSHEVREWMRERAPVIFEVVADASKSSQLKAEQWEGFAGLISGDLSTAVEAFMFSGDPHWGCAAAAAVDSGGAEVVKRVVDLAVLLATYSEHPLSSLLERVRDFLERGYRELSRAVTTVEECAGRMGEVLLTKPLPEPGASPALLLERDSEASKLRERAHEVAQELDGVLSRLSALRVELLDFRLRTTGLSLSSLSLDAGLREWVKALSNFDVALRRVAEEARDLQLQVGEVLKLLEEKR